MKRNEAYDSVQKRNKRQRLATWALVYVLLIVGLGIAIYLQAKRVDTLGFANGQLQLTTSKTKYTVGDTISYTLKNGLSEPITLKNTCPQEPLYAYSWTNNAWVRIHDTAKASVCKGEPSQFTIPAGGSYSQNFSNWPNLFSKPGIYRIVALANNYTALPYTDFQVVAKNGPPTVITRTQVVIQKIITPIYVSAPSDQGGGGGGDN